MTLDRDIRFSPDMIRVTQFALRDEIKRRTRSITKAEASRAAGNKIQENVLQEHYDALVTARATLEALEVARRQIAGYGTEVV